MKEELNKLILMIILFTLLYYLYCLFKIYVLFITSKLIKIINLNINLFDGTYSYIFQFILSIIFVEQFFYKSITGIINTKLNSMLNYVIDENKFMTNKLILIFLLFILSILFVLFSFIFEFIYLKKNINTLFQYNSINYSSYNFLINDIILPCVLAPIIEEYFYRLRFDSYYKYIKKSYWLLFNAYIFAIVHSPIPIILLLRFFSTYCILSLSYLLFKNFLLNVCLHSIWNFLIFIFDYKYFYNLMKLLFKIDDKDLYILFYSYKSLIVILIILSIILSILFKFIRRFNFKNNKIIYNNYF
jgi:hypothetical protein